MSEYQFVGNIILSGKIVCKTALHIGGAKDTYEIGGMDNPVIKTIWGEPYIPGSSLKGKMRSLLDWSLGKVANLDPHKDKKEVKESGGKSKFGCRCGKQDCPICRIFGIEAETEGETEAEKGRDFGPTRLLVRDAFMDPESEKKLLELGRTTELKMENTINRISGKAEHPRPIERVPEGTEFAFSMVYSVYSVENDGCKKDIGMFIHVLDAMALLGDSYLGGMGSRGSGQVEFKDIGITFRSKDYYLQGKEEQLVDEFPSPRLTQDQRNKLLEDLNKVACDANPGSES